MAIRSRLDFFLAKIAGRNIDVKTLIPRGATSTEETLLLEISDRLDSADRGYESINKVSDYLYKTYYNSLDYEGAYKFFEKEGDVAIDGACSSIRNGDFFGRNFDWVYDNNAEFVVYTPAIADRYASVGVAGGFSELSNEFVQSGKYSRYYKILPFKLYDGVNEYGVVCSMNVVPADKGVNKSIPTEESEVTISGYMVVRYVLDHFKTAIEAANYMKEHMTIYFPKALHDLNYELHYMIADGESTYLVEFVNNAAIVVNMTEGSGTNVAGKPYMTNFYLNDVVFNDDGSVYTPADYEDGDAQTDNNITPNGAGLERYNYIVENYSTANTESGMRDLLDGLKYTRAYPNSEDPADPAWYTEFVGVNGLTVSSTPEEYQAIEKLIKEIFANRSRDDGGMTWQTVHSSVYDIANKCLKIIVQESGLELSFCLDTEGSGGMPDPTPYEDGTVLIKVGNDWKPQSGYGFKIPGNITNVEWDDDPTGKESFEMDIGTFVRVSDALAVGELQSVSITLLGDEFEDVYTPLVNTQSSTTFFLIEEGVPVAVSFSEDVDFPEIGMVRRGLYFLTTPEFYVGVLRYGREDIVSQFANEFLPTGGFGYTDTENKTPVILVDDDVYFELPFSTTLSGKGLLGENELCEVYFDSEMFTCVATINQAGDIGLGNLSLMSESLPDTGEPFYMHNFSDDLVIKADSSGDHHIKVVRYVDTIHTIDEKYIPQRALSSNLKWGKETHGDSDATDVYLPDVEDPTVVNELIYIFEADGSIYSFTAPDGYILGDDDGFVELLAGNTITYSDLTDGSVYEANFKVIDDTHIAMVMKEWKTA